MSPYMLSANALAGPGFAKIRNWNKSLPTPLNTCVHQLIADCAKLYPVAEAVVSDEISFTYQTLDALSNVIAHRLVAAGVRPGTFVPLSFEHSAWAIVAMLGVWKAGAAFAPLPAGPLARVEDMLNQLDAVVVGGSPSRLTQLKTLPHGSLEIGPSSLAHATDTELAPIDLNSDSQSLAYAIFTSGSTGTPKAAQVTHCNLSTYVFHWSRAIGIDHKSRVFQYSSYLFDVSMSDIWTPLCVGGAVCVPSEDDRFNNIPGSLKSLRATHAMFVPSLLSTIQPNELSLKALHTLSIIGEKSPAYLVDRWTSVPGLRFVNAYGPAECCPVSSLLDMSINNPSAGNIGRAMGSCLWIVNPDNVDEPLPIGSEGEIIIEGPLIGKGYIKEPGKTAATFVSIPAWLEGFRNNCEDPPSLVPSHTSACVYRTGDLARLNDDGTLMYIGRADLQVKIRGQRTELGEIEQQLQAALPAGSDMAVEVATINNQNSLVAFVALSPILSAGDGQNNGLATSGISQNLLSKLVPELIHQLKSRLPDYMIPASFVAMDFIPRLRSAKTNRTLLRSMASSIVAHSPSLQRATYRQPCTDVEIALCHVWAACFSLETASLSADESFFALGGDSITAIRLMGELRRRGIAITIKDVFSHPILSDLATVARITDIQKAPTQSFQLVPKDSLPSVKTIAAEQCNIAESDIRNIFPAPMNSCWFMMTSEAAPNWWTSYLKFPLPADVDLDKYCKAWATVVSENDILRSRIIKTETAIWQIVLKEEKEPVRTADNWLEFCRSERKTTMNWGESLSRFCVIQDRDHGGRHFVWTAKHALFDAWALHLLQKKISDVYCYGDQGRLSDLTTSDIILHKQTSSVAEAKQWFHAHFAGARPRPVFSTPKDHQFVNDVYHYQDLDHVFLPAISEDRPSFTMSTYVGLAWALVIAQRLATKDVSLGLVRSGRNIPLAGTDTYLGPLAQYMPLRVRFGPDSLVQDLLQKYQDDWIESSVHDAYSFHELIDADTDPMIMANAHTTVGLNIVHPMPSTTRSDPISEGARTGLPAPTEIPAGFTQKPINLNVYLKEGPGLRVKIRRDARACTAELADAFMKSFARVIEQLLDARDGLMLTDVTVPDTTAVPASYL
ncbi:nonribosomal peptide synthase SidD [Aureobasidium subglaciale]|nr:nonribosomal peptide synthase SidD [Aureobasidium subglaciale]